MKQTYHTAKILVATLIGSVILLSGCGGGGGDTNTTDTPTANNTPIATADTLTVDRAGATATVDVLANDTDADGDTLTLQSITTPAHGTAIIVGGKIRYTPPADYSGTVTFDYTTTDGSATATATVTVTVNKAWDGTPTLLLAGTSSVNIPEIAMDSDGNAMVVWYMYDGISYYRIYARHYTSLTKSWSTATPIDNGSNDATDPSVAMDPNGNAMTAWMQTDSNRSIYANHYNAAGTWEGTTVIETGTQAAFPPSIAMDSSGNAMAVWRQRDDAGHDNIYANHYAFGGTWNAGATKIDTLDTATINPRVAMDSHGNAMAIWMQKDTSNRQRIYASRYACGSGFCLWSSPETINSTDGEATNPKQIAMDPDGNAIAVWEQIDSGAHGNIYANRYTYGGSWNATTTQIDGLDTYASWPQVAMDANGNAMAVWQQINSSSTTDIHASHYGAGGQWESAVIIDNESGDAKRARIAMDPDGNAMAVWYQNVSGHNRIFASHYGAGTTWERPVMLENKSGDAEHPRIVMDANGNAMAVWKLADGTFESIFVSRYW
jgi:hypothetical protein